MFVCLFAQVDTNRNLVYVRGQVPGPSGRMVLLRDAYNIEVGTFLTLHMPMLICTAGYDAKCNASAFMSATKARVVCLQLGVCTISLEQATDSPKIQME